MAEIVDVVVVGGGHAGLATSYELAGRSVPHVVLERERPGEAWRSQRWDSFTMVTPNWMTHLPGLPYGGADPDGFLALGDWLAYFDRYVERLRPPLRCGVAATAVRPAPAGRGFLVDTSAGPIAAASVVVATGVYHLPRTPASAAGLPADVLQLHTSTYRNPGALPPGAVLVVGTGQSGRQIAEELYRAGRRIYLSVGRTKRVPRRYRGRDVMWWAQQPGFAGLSRAGPSSLSANTGRDGGRSLNLHRFARDGVALLGRLAGVDGATVSFAPDLLERLAEADATDAAFKRAVDEYVARTGLAAPPAEPGADDGLRDGYATPVVRALDLRAAGIATVVWGTGFRHDFGWVRLPVFDAAGYPICERGATGVPGIYFVGTAWRAPGLSTLIGRVGPEAAHVVNSIAEGRG